MRPEKKEKKVVCAIYFILCISEIGNSWNHVMNRSIGFRINSPNVIQSIHLHRHRLSYQFQPLKSCSMKARTLSLRLTDEKRPKKPLKRPAGTYQYGLYYIQTEKKTSSRQYIQEENWKKVKKVVSNLHSFHSFFSLQMHGGWPWRVTKVWCRHKNRKKGQKWAVLKKDKV